MSQGRSRVGVCASVMSAPSRAGFGFVILLRDVMHTRNFMSLSIRCVAARQVLLRDSICQNAQAGKARLLSHLHADVWQRCALPFTPPRFVATVPS